MDRQRFDLLGYLVQRMQIPSLSQILRDYWPHQMRRQVFKPFDMKSEISLIDERS